MKKTALQRTKFPFAISHHHQLFFIGSCFSDHIGKKTKEVGIPTFQPLGTVFNPYSIADFLSRCIENDSLEDTIVQRQDVFLSWLTNSEIFGYKKEELIATLNTIKKETTNQITKSDYLFVTLGTAWVYRLLSENKIVANCHKFPSDHFQKELLTVSSIVDMWEKVIAQLKENNAKLKIIFTVSPVRHSKDGLENNFLSKSILRTAIHSLQEKFDDCYYFPAFEKVNDELRDYAYFNQDGVHPNHFAIDEVWQLFLDSFVDSKTKEIIEQFLKLRTALNHKSLHPKSQENIAFKKKIEEEIKKFKLLYPTITFNWT